MGGDLLTDFGRFENVHALAESGVLVAYSAEDRFENLTVGEFAVNGVEIVHRVAYFVKSMLLINCECLGFRVNGSRLKEKVNFISSVYEIGSSFQICFENRKFLLKRVFLYHFAGSGP